MKDKLFYACIGFVICLLSVLVLNGRFALQPAHAQMPGAGAGSTTVALGELHRGLLPIVVVDAVDNTLLLYEADLTRTTWRLELKNARTYRYDKQLREVNTTPEIDQVRRMLERAGN